MKTFLTFRVENSRLGQRVFVLFNSDRGVETVAFEVAYGADVHMVAFLLTGLADKIVGAR